MDELIWNNGRDYFIEENDFDITNKTKLPAGTELIVYNDNDHEAVMFCFASKEGNWINYKKSD